MRHQPALDFEPWVWTGFGATKMLFRLADTDTKLGLDTAKYGTQKHMDFDL